MCRYTTLLIMFGFIILFLIISESKSHCYNQKEKLTTTYQQNIDSSPIQLIDNFISLTDCDQLIDLAKSRYTTSTVYVSTHGSVDSVARSSSCAYFKRAENDLIKSIETKVCQMFGINPTQIEPLQIAKYEKTQQYKYHFDFFGNETDQISNQRVYTIIVYLNDLEEIDGGATHFPKLKIRTYPYKTRALCWNNLDSQGVGNPLTLHAGEPILTDRTKYILTIWTRQAPY